MREGSQASSSLIMYALLLALLVAGSATAIPWEQSTPLDEYVFSDDGMFSYDLLASYEMGDHSLLVFNMTSQQWMDESVSEDPIWYHFVTVAIPATFTYTDAAMLYIGNGNKNEDPPTEDSDMSRRIGEFARDVGVPVVYIRNVPFQPTVFTGDVVGRLEDQIIARTWRLFIEQIVDDPNVNLLLPMVKAAKRAADLLVEVVAQETGNTITKIMPTGYSKRGWTSWLLASVDPRVFCVAPIVLDLLNWHPNLHHHNQAYGGWSWAFEPYWQEGVSRYIDHPRSRIIFDEHAIDPFMYNERLAPLPKLIVSATGDQFFLLDDSHYFFDQLDGENNFMQIMENTDHGLGGHTDRLWQNYRSFFVASYEEFDFPEIEQERIVEADSGRITVSTDRAPTLIRGWWADTTNVTVETDDEGNEVHRRDFRLRTLRSNNPIVWEEIAVEDLGDNNFQLQMDTRQEDGYRGFFIEMSFEGPTEQFNELNFATEINIMPDSFPFERCQSEEECRGRLK